jgi:hypothetical protein
VSKRGCGPDLDTLVAARDASPESVHVGVVEPADRKGPRFFGVVRPAENRLGDDFTEDRSVFERLART